MQCGKWMAGWVLGGSVLVVGGGCVSLDEHRRLQAQNRNLIAEKEAMAQELHDSRGGSGSLRTRLDALEREVRTKDELVTNLRSENQLLEEMRRLAQNQLADMAGKQTLGDIAIVGPKLPQPLDSALKRFADEHPSAVVYDSVHGTVKWKSDLLFALGSDVVMQSSFEALKGFTEIVKSSAAGDFEVIVVGHTDNQPIRRPETMAKHPTNWHLSAHRAIAVGGVLRENGYGAERIGVMGFGEYRPVAPNSAEPGRSQNRRVEIYLIPKGSIVEATACAGWQVEGEALAFARLAR